MSKKGRYNRRWLDTGGVRYQPGISPFCSLIPGLIHTRTLLIPKGYREDTHFKFPDVYHVYRAPIGRDHDTPAHFFRATTTR
jgi:hypothetical protein